MIRYITQRLIESIVVLFVMSFVIYALIGLMPGDPVDLMITADPRATSEDAARLRALYGLDRPIGERYVAWLGAAVQGDLGYSRIHARPVLEVLWPRLGNTAALMGVSFALAIAIALPCGLWAAVRPRTVTDTAINLAAFAGISVPPFWLAILLIILFAVVLGWLPAGGMPSSGAGLGAGPAYLVLPVATLTIVTVGGIIRFVRAAAIEALRQDYVRTARAKGLSGRQVVLGHVLRNAMIPVVTILALNFGALFSGALITETMFGFPGMGRAYVQAISQRDYSMIMGTTLIYALLVAVANLSVDIVYVFLDPRIRLTE